MIYIFDDNRYGQMSINYVIDFLKKLAQYDFVRHIQKSSKNTEGYVFLNDATAVFIHDSFPDGDNYDDKGEYRKEIIARAKYRKIPYVNFSNQFAITVFDDSNSNSIKAIKKDRFYFNLINFLDDFAQNRELKIERLAIGADYEKAKTTIIEDRLCTFLLVRNGNFYYEDDIRIDNEQGKDIIELFLFLYGKKGEQEFLSFHKAFRGQKATAKDLKQYVKKIVNQILEKYED